MLEFPVPRWHELDGGRYIGTDDLVITRDPEEGWVNVGTYRIMVHGPDRWRSTCRRENMAGSTKKNITNKESRFPSRFPSAIIQSILSLRPPTCRIGSTNTIMPEVFSAGPFKWSKAR